MIRIDMTRQDTNHPDKRLRHHGRAWCKVGDQHFEAEGPAPIYKLTTLLRLHGHGGADFEVWDDLSPFGNPGGLAMTGRVRNWASFETPNGNPIFRMKSKPDPNFTPEQRATVAKAASVVVSRDADSQGTFAPRCATPPSDGPRGTRHSKMTPLRPLSEPAPRRRRDRRHLSADVRFSADYVRFTPSNGHSRGRHRLPVVNPSWFSVPLWFKDPFDP